MSGARHRQTVNRYLERNKNMKFRTFANTKLKVSQLCLGTVNFGTAIPSQAARRQLSQFVDAGGNFIDTAHVYGDWEPEILCRSERTIGAWLKENSNRDKIILVTKGAHPLLDNMDVPRVSPTEIEKDLTESLHYLNTDYIDIYFLHRDDPSIPVGIIIDYLDKKVTEGKIRYYGCSNWSLSRIKEAAEYSKKKRSSGFICNQLMWSLADINVGNLDDQSLVTMDQDTYEYHCLSELNAMAYMSIAKGYFTRRNLGENLPERVEKVYANPTNDRIYSELLKISSETNLSLMDLSILYLMNHNFPSVPIASFDTPQQMETGLKCCDMTIEQGLIRQLHELKRYRC